MEESKPVQMLGHFFTEGLFLVNLDVKPASAKVVLILHHRLG